MIVTKMTKEEFIKIFVDGAKWWEWHTCKATMWNSDRRLAEEEAEKRWNQLQLLR